MSRGPEGIRVQSLVVVAVIAGCTSAPVAAPSAAVTGSAAAPSASASATAEPASRLLGEWRAAHPCEHIVRILTEAGHAGTIESNITGNGLLPGASESDPLPDPSRPCKGTVLRDHYHLFARDGTFASFDWRHRQVDEGTYTIVDSDTVSINATEFGTRSRETP